MTLDIRNLRYFLGVTAARSISSAAENLHIAQPALSVQMRQLEQELGASLLDRSARGVEPTAAGRLLQERATEILSLVDRLYSDIRTVGAEPQGRVSIGLPQSMARLLTLPLVEAALAELPKVRLQFIEMSTGFVPQHLLKGDIDLGLTFGPPAVQNIRCEELVQEDLVLVGPPGRFSDHAAFNGRRAAKVRLRQLAEQAMVLPEGTHSLRVLLDDVQRRASIKLRTVVEVNAIPQLIELASAGVGLTILSYAAVRDDLRDGRVSVARIVAPEITRPVCLCRSSGAQPTVATLAVLDLLYRLVAEMKSDDRWPTRVQGQGRAPGKPG
ncbi:DNA-binding transcriptional LysR family regulator [Variovorax paradoxus]|uniref:LysR family transcriptional regulator n=1 Tax=Variovorax paradoxus TaxID=34073 RepID=UPI002785EB2B|nr:LysR family transcriptional regulator [Variovorax paradoxus]MDP9962907.1 DNA-binding transcriptional LysR family regulator [Variovorax paradoxus]